MNSRPIGVFDSGIGGLTVVRSLIEGLPSENVVYFGDTARIPYGSKSPQVVREYTAHETDVLLRYDVKMIVVACNTVSAVALDVVQKRAAVPVVGVIGTVGTISSNTYVHAIRQLDATVHVFNRACLLFVPLVEEGWLDHNATALIAKEYLFPFALSSTACFIIRQR